MFPRTIKLAEIDTGNSPIRIRDVSKRWGYHFKDTIIEDLEISREGDCGCFTLKGMERVHKHYLHLEWHSTDKGVTDPEILALVEDEDIKEHNEPAGWFRPARSYNYIKGWVTLKERKPFSATLCGEIMIIEES